jgi:hypothetical protein
MTSTDFEKMLTSLGSSRSVRRLEQPALLRSAGGYTDGMRRDTQAGQCFWARPTCRRIAGTGPVVSDWDCFETRDAGPGVAGRAQGLGFATFREWTGDNALEEHLNVLAQVAGRPTPTIIVRRHTRESVL